MSNPTYPHYFVAGLFVASVFSPYIWLMCLLGAVLMLRWGNIILPIMAALLIDISLVSDRGLHNLYGFLLTFPTIIVALSLIKVRKFLKF